jgi:hypothetical protein
MGQADRTVGWTSALAIALTAPLRWIRDHWRPRPLADAGVREPRRPKPTLPAAAIALAEPRTEVRRWIRLTNRRDR